MTQMPPSMIAAGHTEHYFLSASLLTRITWHPHTVVFTPSSSLPPISAENSLFSSLHLYPALPSPSLLPIWAEMDASGSDVCIRDETTLPSSLLFFLEPSSVHPSIFFNLILTSLEVSLVHHPWFLQVPEKWLQQPPGKNLLIHTSFISFLQS